MPEKIIRQVEIEGRTVSLAEPTETQMMLMGRSAKKAQKAAQEEDMGDMLTYMVEALDIVEYLIPDVSDRDFLADLMRKGQLEVRDLLDYATDGKVTAGTAQKKAAKAVTRGKARS